MRLHSRRLSTGNYILEKQMKQHVGITQPEIYMAAVGDAFKPGEKVENSGFYRVIHDPTHTQEHEVTCIAHKKFPPCRDCPHPRFVLVRKAIHIGVHEHFKGQ
jgi:hypothetical protein